jgi:hypothetical protein
MPKSFLSGKNSKGQWFLISAVIVSGAFLAISVLFRGYYEIDTSLIAKYNEDYHFQNIKEQFNNIVQVSDCTNMEKNLKEFVYFAEQSMQERGYLLFINYTIYYIDDSCIVRRGFLLASEKAVIYENINPSDVITGYE